MRSPWFARSLIGLVVLAAVVGMFGLVGQWAVSEGWFESVDRFVIVAEPDHPLTTFLIGVTWLGTVTGVVTVSVVMLLVLLWRRQFRGAAALFVSLVTSAYANDFVKEWVARERPPHAELVEAGGFSYLSGHAFVCTAVYGLFAYVLLRDVESAARRWVLGVLAAIAVGLIGFSRIYLGVHHTSDVIGGFILGAIWLVVWALAFRPFKPKGRSALSF